MKLLRLPLRCTCGRFPPLRLTGAMRALAERCSPEELLETWQCKCGRIHELTADIYRRAA